MIDETETLYEITLQGQQALVGADTEPDLDLDLDQSFDTTDEQGAPLELVEADSPWWKAISSAMHVPDPGWALDRRVKGPPQNGQELYWPEGSDEPVQRSAAPR